MAKKNTDMPDNEMSIGSNESDKAYDKLKGSQEGSAKAKRVLSSAGYAKGGKVHSDEKEDKKLIKKELGKAKIEVKKHGGKVAGRKPAARADKFARGGSAPRGKHTAVNINLAASQADKADSFKKGAMAGAQMAAQKLGAGRPGAGAPMQARPPMPPPGAAGPMGPAGAPPAGGVPPTMQKRGGRTYAKGGAVKDWTKGAGAGGGEGRLAKAKTYGAKVSKK